MTLLDDVALRAVYELERFYGYSRSSIARMRGGDTGRPLWQRAGFASEISFVNSLGPRYRRLGWR